MTPADALSEEELPTELQSRSDKRDDRPLREFAVEVVEGPDAGVRLSIPPTAPSRILLGSSPACELRLNDRLVSRRHAALEVSGNALRLTDLDSTNGTLVQGVRIVEALLEGGETIHVGGSSLRVERIEPREKTELPVAMRFGRVIGGSLEMRRLYPLCERLAASDIPVVIEGETGTGKEQLAEALHECGPRASAPFVVFDCTAVSAGLLESVLFGHERGAFTGAVTARKGVFELADGGTLLIDEIGDLELGLQAKLLRAIERGEVQRVGAARWIQTDVRVIAATRRNLDREIQAGRFRDDLFFRLAVSRIELPPLRRRGGDIALLARHFWRSLGGKGAPPDEFMKRLESYEWPGNVRELYNAVARRLSLGEMDSSEQSADPTEPAAPGAAASPSLAAGAAPEDAIERVLARELPFPRARDEVLAEFERRYVTRLLSRYRGSVTRAAAASGIALRYFQRIRARQGKGTA